MKTFLIIILLLALAAAACFTRPDRRELMLYVLDNRVPSQTWRAADIEMADELARSATFKNRILWTDVERDGKVIFTGAFGHWVPRDINLPQAIPGAAQLADLTKLVVRQEKHGG